MRAKKRKNVKVVSVTAFGEKSCLLRRQERLDLLREQVVLDGTRELADLG